MNVYSRIVERLIAAGVNPCAAQGAWVGEREHVSGLVNYRGSVEGPGSVVSVEGSRGSSFSELGSAP